MKENLKPCVYKLWKQSLSAYLFLRFLLRISRIYSVNLLGVDNYACVNFLVDSTYPVQNLVSIGKLTACNRVLFVERSGESRLLARLRTESSEPKGNQVLIARLVSVRVPETG